MPSQRLDPAVYSISYLALIEALQDYPEFSVEDRGNALIEFYTSFDARQVRYAGNWFSGWLKRLAKQNFPLPVRKSPFDGGDSPLTIAKQHDVKVGLVSTAILRLDPTGSLLTDRHLVLVRLAYETDTAEFAFDAIDKEIVYFPNMGKGTTFDVSNKYLCDLNLSPPEYISPDTSLTESLDVESVLQYNLLSGLLYCSRSRWDKAQKAFERIITHPTRDGGVSKIMVDAYNKWLLVSLLVSGRAPELPATAGSNAKKIYETAGKPYAAIASHFDPMAALPLKQEVEANVLLWQTDRNIGLVQQVLAAHQKWQIMELRNVYTKISLSSIRDKTCSAETGASLATESEVERLIEGMIQSGMLKGSIQKPDGKPAYLEFFSDFSEMSELEYKNEMASAMRTMKHLQSIYRSTSYRLSTNKYWLNHLAREKKREKENASQNIPIASFESQVEDEDLMSGIMSGV